MKQNEIKKYFDNLIEHRREEKNLKELGLLFKSIFLKDFNVYSDEIENIEFKNGENFTFDFEIYFKNNSKIFFSQSTINYIVRNVNKNLEKYKIKFSHFIISTSLGLKFYICFDVVDVKTGRVIQNV